MIVWSNSIENVLSRIYLEGVARNGMPPQIYWEAKQALDRLDKTCLTVNSNSDPNCPVGWRRNNYPILTVGKKNNRLKFSYTKKRLNNGDILIIVEEVADTYGNILTEDAIYNKNIKTNIMKQNKKTIRLSESELTNMITESVKQVLSELDWKTYANAARKRKMQGADNNDVFNLDYAASEDLRKKYGIKNTPYYPTINTTFSDDSQYGDF